MLKRVWLRISVWICSVLVQVTDSLLTPIHTSVFTAPAAFPGHHTAELLKDVAIYMDVDRKSSPALRLHPVPHLQYRCRRAEPCTQKLKALLMPGAGHAVTPVDTEQCSDTLWSEPATAPQERGVSWAWRAAARTPYCTHWNFPAFPVAEPPIPGSARPSPTKSPRTGGTICLLFNHSCTLITHILLK